MSGNEWYKTDNVAKVFLATLNKRASRTMRLSCELTERINPEILQQALLETIRVRPQFQVRIRRGVFWHYLEDTDTIPIVAEENSRPCPLLYSKDYKGILHYKVTYFNNRINLDIFHALSDGTGAMEFLDVLVGYYIKLSYPQNEGIANTKIGSGASDGDLRQDGFSQFHEKTKLKDALSMKDDAPNAYHFHGTKLPYDQLQFFEIKMNVSSVLPKAKELGVSLGSYMGARIMLSMYKSMPRRFRNLPISVSLPVNLRNFYNSSTSRNFFNSVMVSHVFTGEENLESLSKEFDEKLKDSISFEKIHKQMDRFQKFQEVFFVKLVPLFIKQLVVKAGSKTQNRHVSFVLSNLGVLKVDDNLAPYIKGFSAFCSHEEIFITLFSFRDEFKLGITYAYSDTTLVKDIVRDLVNDGIDVVINATEVVRT